MWVCVGVCVWGCGCVGTVELCGWSVSAHDSRSTVEILVRL